MEKEIWKDIDGYNGLYQVSNLGNIRSFKSKKTIIMKPHIDDKGYHRITLSKHNKKKYKKIHQLVAICFLGHIPNGMNLIVDHIDNNKLNNNVCNLQLITNRENASKDQFRRNKTSKYVGVYWDKARNKWCSEIKIKNKKIHLGRFENELDAVKAYQKQLKKISK